MLGSPSKFERYYNDVIEAANNTFTRRGQDYNRVSPIRDYWVYGVRSVFHAVWGKALRLKSLVPRSDDSVSPNDRAVFEDSCVDLINYAAFLWAENRCQMEDEAMRRTREQTGCDFTDRYPEPANDPMERMVLDEGPDESVCNQTGQTSLPFGDRRVHPRPEPSVGGEFYAARSADAEGTRTHPGDGTHDVGSGEHPPVVPRANRTDKTGRVFLRDPQGRRQE